MNRTLIFVHVAKTGGLSLRNAIKTPDTLTVSHTAEFSEVGKKASKATVAVGHMPYGLHEHLDKDREYDYLTVVRHPVERVLSKYYYTTNLAVRGDNVVDFMTGQFSHALHNLMVKQFSGVPILEKRKMTEADLQKALDNLEEFKYIGFTRSLDKVFSKLKRDYGFTGRLGHSNKTRNNRIESVSQNAIDAILEFNELDLRLFEWLKFAEDR